MKKKYRLLLLLIPLAGLLIVTTLITLIITTLITLIITTLITLMVLVALEVGIRTDTSVARAMGIATTGT